jgi:putative ABC transport system permease protein
LDYLIEFQFFTAQRQDITLGFIEPTSGSVLYEVARLPGVLEVEPLRSVPVKLRFRHRERRTGIMGLRPRGSLYRLLDDSERLVALPPNGLLLSRTLARVLEVQVGQSVRAEVMEARRPILDIPVVGIIDEYSGTNAYMHIDALHGLMREGDAVTGAFLTADPNELDQLYTTLKRTPRVADVTVKRATLQSFNETQAENQRIMQFFNAMFAAIIAFGVVYNTARISLVEHSRELATLRVIGLTRTEISTILLGELGVLTLLALPIGMIVGFWLASWTAVAFESELWRIPLVVTRRTYGFAAAVTLAASAVSGLVVRRSLDRLDLVAVLKSKE